MSSTAQPEQPKRQVFMRPKDLDPVVESILTLAMQLRDSDGRLVSVDLHDPGAGLRRSLERAAKSIGRHILEALQEAGNVTILEGLDSWDETGLAAARAFAAGGGGMAVPDLKTPFRTGVIAQAEVVVDLGVAPLKEEGKRQCPACDSTDCGEVGGVYACLVVRADPSHDSGELPRR